MKRRKKYGWIVTCSIPLLIAIIFNSAYAQAGYNLVSPVELTILNYKKTFNLTEQIKLKIKNTSGKKINYSVGYEAKFKNEWEALSSDITHKNQMVVEIYRLKPGEVKFINFQISDKPWKTILPGPRRFFVLWSYTSGQDKKWINYNEFMLVNK